MRNNFFSWLSFGLIGLATGCASSQWHQAGKTAEETRAELAQCKKMVQAADAAFTIDSSKTKAELIRGCMAMKGYTQTGQTNFEIR